mgnify:CR=1 FL=1
MTTYRVDIDGVAVWDDTQTSYLGVEHFPSEYLGRPSSGFIELIVDDTCISKAVPEGME